MAAFLVDLWAMGLKDAWGRTDISYSEFDEGISGLDARLGTRPLNLGTAKHLVYGGIELARELGFRLPRRYERWTAILGSLPKGETPDMSLFRCDGKVRLVCNMQDLESRLIGTTPDKFLARGDVDFILGDDDFTLADDEDDAVDDAITEFEQAMVDRARQWCFANGQTPHPLLPELIRASTRRWSKACPLTSILTTRSNHCRIRGAKSWNGWRRSSRPASTRTRRRSRPRSPSSTAL